jgi:hypothetical protein
MARRGGAGLVVGRQGLLEPAEIRQRHAAIAQGVDEARRQRQGRS